jgi:signal transduction histidine kinase
MSHELRTPLNAIIGYSELLQVMAQRKQDTTYTADLERIRNSGQNLLTLINDILDFSKLEAGKMEVELQAVEVQHILGDIQETIQPLASRNANELTIHAAPGVPPVHADPMRLKQCLLNLLSNACKFTQAGRIELTIDHQEVDGEDVIVFNVTDTGVGVSPEQAARLFQPFSQADASTTRKFGGTGLGLSITKNLCEAMGGTISLESELGAGSTFTLRLPVAQSAALCGAV